MVQLEFEYGHRLLNYIGACSNIHGHHAIVEVKLNSADLDSLGMVVDFSELKLAAKEWINAKLDHACLLHKDDTEVIAFFKKIGFKIYVMKSNPIAENIAKEIFDYLKGVSKIRLQFVRVWESSSQYAEYQE